MAFRLLEANDESWHRALERLPHDVYHLPGYATVCATHESQPVLLALAEADGESIAAPVMVRPIERGGTDLAVPVDVTSPYGYPGLVCTSAESQTKSVLLGELIAGLRALGAVSAFLRCHPIVGIDLDTIGEFGTAFRHGEHVVVDIPTLPGPVVASFRADHRRGIRLLLEAGYRLEVDDPQHFECFPELYRETMRRVDADEYYLFPDAYFEALASELQQNLHSIAVIAPDGEIAAMSLLLVCGGLGEYHLSATAPAFLSAAPAKLAVLGMIETCAKLGVQKLNLGSGLGGRADSLFKFKSGFSKLRAPFATARFILDQRAYADLAGATEAPADFFPAYRYGG